MRISDPDIEATPVGATKTMTMKLGKLSPARHDLVDAAFLTGLLLFAFIGFSSTFDSWRFAGVVVLGLLLGLLIGHMSVTWRWPWPLAVLCSLVLYFLIGGPIGDLVQTWHGLPTPSSVSDLAALLVSGWKAMLTTLPPLASDGLYIAIVLLLAMLSASLGQIVARRTHRVVPPLLIPTVTLMVVIFLGTLAAPLAGVVGVGFTALGFGWLANRYPRRRRVLGGNRLRAASVATAALMLVASLAAGFFLGPKLPGVDRNPRLVARTYVVPPIDLKEFVSPLVGFRKYSSKQLDVYFDKELLRVTGGETGSWLRFAVMDSYNGHVWSAAGDPNSSASGFVRLGSAVPNMPADATADVEVEIEAAYANNSDLNPWVPGFGRTSQLTFEGDSGRAHAEALRFDLNSNQGIVPDRLKAGDVVRLKTGVPRRFEKLAAETVPAQGRLLPDSDTDFIGPLAQNLSSQQSPPMARLRQAAEKLKAGAWSDGTADGQQHFLPGHGRFRLNQFLTSTEFVGSDEQYAAVFALIANRYGFPARVAIGAVLPSSGQVKGSDVKAWVEIQVDEGEWVTVPTDTFTPDRSKLPNEAPKQADQQDAATNVPPPHPARPPGTYGEMLDTEPATNRVTQQPLPPSDVLLTWLLYVGVPVGGLLLILIGILAAKALRSRRRRTSGAMWARVAAGWRDLVDLSRDTGRIIPSGTTRLEQSVLIGGGQLTTLAQSADAAVFGGFDLSQDDVASYWGQVKAARPGILGELPWWRRIFARISLKSLLPRSRRSGKTARTGVQMVKRSRRTGR